MNAVDSIEPGWDTACWTLKQWQDKLFSASTHYGEKILLTFTLKTDWRFILQNLNFKSDSNTFCSVVNNNYNIAKSLEQQI